MPPCGVAGSAFGTHSTKSTAAPRRCSNHRSRYASRRAISARCSAVVFSDHPATSAAYAASRATARRYHAYRRLYRRGAANIRRAAATPGSLDSPRRMGPVETFPAEGKGRKRDGGMRGTVEWER